jgi:hypothetical protein
MELASHGLRIEKGGRACALTKWLMNERLVLRGFNKWDRRLIPCFMVKVFGCSTKNKKWARGWTSCLSCSRYFLLLVSYTMIIISFAQQQSCEYGNKEKIPKWYSQKLWHKNKVWFNYPTYNGYFDSNGRGWLLELLGMCPQLLGGCLWIFHMIETCISWWCYARIPFYQS